MDFVVITALEEERDAFLATIRGARRLDKAPGDIHTFYHATVKTRRRDHSEYQVVVTCLLNMGPVNASAQTASVLNRWKPRYVLLIGIACGVRGEVMHGDVLVATQVADYTLGKQTDGRRQVRWKVFPCGASLLDSANNIPKNWAERVAVPRPGKGKAERHKGVVASGGDVISDDQVIAAYSESWPKLIGIEMEAGGVAAAVHQSSDRPEFLMIKGVSDFGKDKHDDTVKPWRDYASHAAAAFAVSLIKSGPARGLSEITERRDGASAEEEQKRAAERRWQYIQSHPIKGFDVLFLLKGAVGFRWFLDVLDETRITFRHEKSFKLGQLVASSPPPNTKEHSRSLDQPYCSFWEVYEPEPGYLVKKISPEGRELSLVAGFDATAPWSTLGVDRVENLQDLALLTEIGVSIPAQAYQVGVEEFTLRLFGETFSFSVKLSEEAPLEALHEMARMQFAMDMKEPMPIGTGFSGVRLLDMFLRQTLPQPAKPDRTKRAHMMGLSGPNGKTISFYPTMPMGFNKTAESKEYTFTITTPPKVDISARIKEVEKKLATDPADGESYVELAAYFMYEGRLLDAVKCLTTATEKAVPNAKIHAMLAESFRRLGRFDEALHHAQKSLALDPDDARVQTEVGACFAEMGEHETALPYFEAAVRVEPSNPGFHGNLCLALVYLKRLPQATAHAQKAANLEPDSAEYALRLGILLELQGERDRALHYLGKAVELDPKSDEAHENLGLVQAKSDQHETAVSSFESAIKIKATPRRCELLGASLADLGRWSEAEAAFRRGLELDSRYPNMRSNLGISLANQGKFAEAATLFEELLADEPDNDLARRILAELRKEG